MEHAEDVSPAELRAELSPVSERFAAFELGDAVVVFDEDASDAWLLSDVAVPRHETR